MKPIIKIFPHVCGALIPILSIAWGLQLAPELGVALFKEQFLAVILGLALLIIFFDIPERDKSNSKFSLISKFLSVASAATLFYLAYDYPRFQLDFAYQTTEMLVIGILTFGFVMEALRRTTGYVLFTIVGLFVVYALVGDLIPAPLTGRSVSLAELFPYLGFDTNAALGTPMSVVATIVVLFIFFGKLLVKSGGGEFFIDIAMAIMGSRRGGAAKISVVASALFGSISGSAVSNVATTGIMTIPLMSRSGYSKTQSGAIEAIASTGGQLMPPIMGAAAFLMAEFLELPYTEVIVAALIPALLYYFAVFVQVDLMAASQSIEIIKDELPTAPEVFKQGWHFLIPFAVLLYALFVLNVEAEIAALYASVAIIVGGGLRTYKDQKIRLKDLVSTFWETGYAMVDLIVIVAAAGFVIGILNISSGGFALTLFLVNLGSSSIGVLLIISSLVCILLGMGMPTSGVYVLLAALVAPALIETGIEPLAAHMFILYFGMMSMITPPIALAAFAAATISNAKPMRTGFESMRLGWVAYIIPILFVVSPTLILRGEIIDILFDVITAIAGVYFISIAVIGYFSRKVNFLYRSLLVLLGIVALIPSGFFSIIGIVSLSSAGVGIAFLIRERYAPLAIDPSLEH